MESYHGQTLSFKELLSIHKVEIPIIQRDYAQGRKDKKEIRANFLTALYDSLSEEQPIKLDFIYGSNINSCFQPLDGQQRLTTLFLLHWYAAIKENVLNSDSAGFISKFSYETRITSRDFCHSLINNPIEIEHIDEDISGKIIDSSWFFLSWKKDPSIDSMLRTIDDIHLQFRNVQNLWTKLTSDVKLVTFYYVELENIGLTDDLYIKMNARGKLLTPFENFKAGFQKHVEDEHWETGKELQDTFAFKIDTTWTDFFWHLFRKNNTIDEGLMRFIAAIGMIRHSIERAIVRLEDRALHLTGLQEKPSSVKPEDFTAPGFEYLIKSFEIYDYHQQASTDLELSMPMWRHEPKNSILSEVVFDDNVYSTIQINSATYTQKVLFFAQTEYLLRVKEIDAVKFREWMRVVRNIVSRADIDKDGNRPDIVRSPQSFDSMINLINELSEGCEDIYTFLSNLVTLKSQLAKDQVEEEKFKAKLIKQSDAYKTVLFEAEDNELLRGKLEFIFRVNDCYQSLDLFDLEKFVEVKDVFKKYFSTEEALTNDLRRAMLTIAVNGNYEFYNYWWSYWHIVGATKRRLFDKFRELEYYMYSEYVDYFKNLVLQLTSKGLKEIIADFKPDGSFPSWKLQLIKNSELLDNGHSNYIAIMEDNSSCYLLKSKRPRDIEGSQKVE